APICSKITADADAARAAQSSGARLTARRTEQGPERARLRGFLASAPAYHPDAQTVDVVGHGEDAGPRVRLEQAVAEQWEAAREPYGRASTQGAKATVLAG
ncbi:hypothetical protein, partial [Brevundimonas sp.]|uniref:hypothetical protein n=1 Tax=Brevundimonas sp. TaxID=1871086 RepID=UPI002899E955